MSCRKKIIEAVLFYGKVIFRHVSASTLKPLDTYTDQSALSFITGNVHSTQHYILYEKVWRSSLSKRRDVFIYLQGPYWEATILYYNYA